MPRNNESDKKNRSVRRFAMANASLRGNKDLSDGHYLKLKEYFSYNFAAGNPVIGSFYYKVGSWIANDSGRVSLNKAYLSGVDISVLKTLCPNFKIFEDEKQFVIEVDQNLIKFLENNKEKIESFEQNSASLLNHEQSRDTVINALEAKGPYPYPEGGAEVNDEEELKNTKIKVDTLFQEVDGQKILSLKEKAEKRKMDLSQVVLDGSIVSKSLNDENKAEIFFNNFLKQYLKEKITEQHESLPDHSARFLVESLHLITEQKYEEFFQKFRQFQAKFIAPDISFYNDMEDDLRMVMLHPDNKYYGFSKEALNFMRSDEISGEGGLVSLLYDLDSQISTSDAVSKRMASGGKRRVIFLYDSTKNVHLVGAIEEEYFKFLQERSAVEDFSYCINAINVNVEKEHAAVTELTRVGEVWRYEKDISADKLLKLKEEYIRFQKERADQKGLSEDLLGVVIQLSGLSIDDYDGDIIDWVINNSKKIDKLHSDKGDITAASLNDNLNKNNHSELAIPKKEMPSSGLFRSASRAAGMVRPGSNPSSNSNSGSLGKGPSLVNLVKEASRYGFSHRGRMHQEVLSQESDITYFISCVVEDVREQRYKKLSEKLSNRDKESGLPDVTDCFDVSLFLLQKEKKYKEFCEAALGSLIEKLGIKREEAVAALDVIAPVDVKITLENRSEIGSIVSFVRAISDSCVNLANEISSSSSISSSDSDRTVDELLQGILNNGSAFEISSSSSISSSDSDRTVDESLQGILNNESAFGNNNPDLQNHDDLYEEDGRGASRSVVGSGSDNSPSIFTNNGDEDNLNAIDSLLLRRRNDLHEGDIDSLLSKLVQEENPKQVGFKDDPEAIEILNASQAEAEEGISPEEKAARKAEKARKESEDREQREHAAKVLAEQKARDQRIRNQNEIDKDIQALSLSIREKESASSAVAINFLDNAIGLLEKSLFYKGLSQDDVSKIKENIQRDINNEKDDIKRGKEQQERDKKVNSAFEAILDEKFNESAIVGALKRLHQEELVDVLRKIDNLPDDKEKATAIESFKRFLQWTQSSEAKINSDKGYAVITQEKGQRAVHKTYVERVDELEKVLNSMPDGHVLKEYYNAYVVKGKERKDSPSTSSARPRLAAVGKLAFNTLRANLGRMYSPATVEDAAARARAARDDFENEKKVRQDVADSFAIELQDITFCEAVKASDIYSKIKEERRVLDAVRGNKDGMAGLSERKNRHKSKDPLDSMLDELDDIAGNNVNDVVEQIVEKVCSLKPDEQTALVNNLDVFITDCAGVGNRLDDSIVVDDSISCLIEDLVVAKTVKETLGAKSTVSYSDVAKKILSQKGEDLRLPNNVNVPTEQLIIEELKLIVNNGKIKERDIPLEEQDKMVAFLTLGQEAVVKARASGYKDKIMQKANAHLQEGNSDIALTQKAYGGVGVKLDPVVVDGNIVSMRVVVLAANGSAQIKGLQVGDEIIGFKKSDSLEYIEAQGADKTETISVISSQIRGFVGESRDFKVLRDGNEIEIKNVPLMPIKAQGELLAVHKFSAEAEKVRFEQQKEQAGRLIDIILDDLEIGQEPQAPGTFASRNCRNQVGGSRADIISRNNSQRSILGY